MPLKMLSEYGSQSTKQATAFTAVTTVPRPMSKTANESISIQTSARMAQEEHDERHVDGQRRDDHHRLECAVDLNT